MQWEYPVYKQPTEEKDGTVAKRAKRALSREEAIAYIRGDDPRPLLVLRECKVCNGTDDALLKGGEGNETTYLLSRWFHCVKVPVDVMEENHPFHNIFQEKGMEHLFVCSADGSNHDPLESQTSRTELWDSMRSLLAKEYKKKPNSSLKQINKLLNKLDVVDTRLGQLNASREEALIEEGPKSKKVKKLDKKIAKEESERSKLHGQIAKASVLDLKRKKVEPKADSTKSEEKS